MRLAYYDEVGDDGYPNYSSEFFTLTAVYLHYLNWPENFNDIRRFRRQLKAQFDFPVRMEFHTKYFLLNKRPYRALGISQQHRLGIVGMFCDLVANLKLKIINVCIVKHRINNPEYRVLDTALRYSIQRIENDIKPDENPQDKFMIITDEGRHGIMRRTAREMQRINYIPSRYGTPPLRREIKSLIEDPLPKDSKQSYFIQIADLVSFVVNLYGCFSQQRSQVISSRTRRLVSQLQVTDWMERLKPSFNILAASADPYGVVIHPR